VILAKCLHQNEGQLVAIKIFQFKEDVQHLQAES
jgi:hypothetical protein